MKRTHPGILRGAPSAPCNDIAPGGMGKIRRCRNFSLLSMNVCAMQGISVAESIVS